MSFTCLNPYVAVPIFTKSNGKKHLKLYSKGRINYDLNELKFKYGEDNVYLLPCGTCESCRRNKAEEWAIRCELESKCHKFNYFVTLTFDDFHIDMASEKDLQKFLDRLSGFGHHRKYKYFACKELGENTERLHFHLVLFCDFEIDLFNPMKIGHFYHFESKLMNQLWKNGFYTISPFETTCARYVAKYTAKNSKLYMSRNIGKQYFKEHYQEIIDDGFKVYSDFGGKFVSYVPSCFIKWFENEDPDVVKEHKEKRKSLAHYVVAEHKRELIVEHDESELKVRQERVIEKGKKKRIL